MVNIVNMDLLSKISLPNLSIVWFAGEVFPTKQFLYWYDALPGVRFVNLYGPIEITLDCTFYKPWQQSGKTVRSAYMTDLLNAIIESGKKVKAVHFEHGWIEFDTNEDYEKMIELAQDGELRQIISII